MRYPGVKSDKEQIFLTPASIMSRYEDWLDPCPHPRPEGFDGLAIDWGEKAFVNPPWGNIRPWVEKALLEREKGCCVHMLIAAKPTTRVFQDIIFPNAEVEWLRGRVLPSPQSRKDRVFGKLLCQIYAQWGSGLMEALLSTSIFHK
jgi:hypothetical protein